MEKPETLQQAIQYFSDEQVCIDTLAALRWPDGKPVCPSCEHTEHYWLATQRRWKCKECWKQFSVKVGTVMEDSALSLTKWFPAIWFVVNCKNGVSSHELSRALAVSQKSTWFMLHRIRLALKNGTFEKIGGKGGPVQCDETYIGGNPQKMHKNRRMALKYVRESYRGVMPNKTAVFGMLDNESRKVRATVVGSVTREVLQEEILKHIAQGSTLHTDESGVYWWTGREKQYVHEVVNHAQEYVRGQVHTNGIENFWSLLKRTLKGTYVAVEPFHLERYVDEQVFRFNHRKDECGNKLTDGDRFNIALSQVAGKRLTFAELTGKVG